MSDDALAQLARPGLVRGVCCHPGHYGERRRDKGEVGFCWVEWAKKELGGHEYLRLVEFRDELPKNLAGKILRRTLREELGRLREHVKGQMKKEG